MKNKLQIGMPFGPDHCVSGLIIAEFLPAGMLTPMAKDLGISEGLAGQAVTATSILRL